MIARIHPMTDPLGKYWPQPENLNRRVAVYETHATISEADWLALPRYEASKPTGVYAGKAWRNRKWLCWYGRVRDGSCLMNVRRALVQP